MTNAGKRRDVWVWVLSLVAVGFGLLTIREGGMTLGGDEAALKAAGHYVPFVLWFNFVAGFAYVIAGAGLWMRQRWAVWLAMAIAAATALTFIAFGAHVASGGLYEQRTVVAMSLRTLVWVAIAAIAWRRLLRRAA
jgi:Kef-type K+ transport system membrane component KefB